MAKKTAAPVLQTEISNDEDWERFLHRKGLIVVDVYSDWSGPCAAMVSTLRKIKMDIGGDTISYAVARNDEITDLERFRGSSEPVWLFIEEGKMVNNMFGADAPSLRRLLTEEIKRVQHGEEPKYKLKIEERGPVEEVRWQQELTVRKVIEEKQKAKEAQEEKQKYEHYLEFMMIMLCEETICVLYPWVFLDENGKRRDRLQSKQYTELAQDLFRMRFEIQEELRIELDKETVEKMFVESNMEVTEDIIAGLTDGLCMIIRLKGKPPHPDWPVPYPNKCDEGVEKCPHRAINDIENYLHAVLYGEPPPVPSGAHKAEHEGTYNDRHYFVKEPDPEVEGDVRRIFPAVWAPPQARSKVHVYKTIFPNYLENTYPYEEPAPPPTTCALKFAATKLHAIIDAYEHFEDAIEHFGIFEYDDPVYAKRLASSPEDFEKKVKTRTGHEVFVMIMKKITEEAFLTFAGLEPYFVTEDEEEAQAMINEYFPEGAMDYVKIERDIQEDFYGEEEEEGEEYPFY